jgi:undecaprenyl-diphosphatase
MFTKRIQAAEEKMVAIDDGARRLFEPYAASPLLRALDLLSKLGDQPQLRVIAGGLMVAGTFRGNARLVRAGARMMIAHEAATLVKGLAKGEIDRTRPRSATDGDDKKPKKGNSRSKEESSFPSGHSAGAIACARAFSREYPEFGSAALGAAGLIAASQVPRCAHYPSDVAAGVAIGLACETLTNTLWKAAQMDERSTSLDEAVPAERWPPAPSDPMVRK